MPLFCGGRDQQRPIAFLHGSRDRRHLLLGKVVGERRGKGAGLRVGQQDVGRHRHGEPGRRRLRQALGRAAGRSREGPGQVAAGGEQQRRGAAAASTVTRLAKDHAGRATTEISVPDRAFVVQDAAAMAEEAIGVGQRIDADRLHLRDPGRIQPETAIAGQIE